MKNQVIKISITDIAEMLDKTPAAISKACSRKAIIKPHNLAIFKTKPTVEEKREMYSKVVFQDEVWHFIKGSDNRFKVSNYVRIKRVYKNHEKFMLPVVRKHCGNMVVKVRFKEIYKVYRVKDLVAAHFLRKPKTGEVLFHSNGIKTDDSAANLKWIDKSKLARKTGHKARSKEVVQIDPQTMVVIAEYRSTRETARHTPYSYQSISNYCNGVVENRYGDLFMWREDYEELYGEVV